LAFARQKVAEISILKRALVGDQEAIEQMAIQRKIIQSRGLSSRTNVSSVKNRLARITTDMLRRTQDHSQRKAIQARKIKLQALPTTTIGSFPQTGTVRVKRAAFRKGEIGQEEYEAFLRSEIERTIRFQEKVGLDVLAHGEFERTDMVEYFGEQLTGIAFTDQGWVQSYGSRCVRPPIIYGDVERRWPMTVTWSVYAQSLTDRPVKGMLTGPVTILEWSFVRDDQPRADTCRQIALAIRDEVKDLEASDIQIIQIDEPALREGLPLRRANWDEYLHWAVECFRLVAGVARDETQIHTHMCYAKFDDIITAIAQMDADVISIEASRSKMDLLETFQQFRYPNDIGPGIYDIHSPRTPSTEEMVDLIRKALQVIPIDRLWINPDCGLKTRTWEEITPALTNLVEAARQIRKCVAT
jgi:5-methyltetrahydropteroyltriglutamate--homocysteine methyltransferase